MRPRKRLTLKRILIGFGLLFVSGGLVTNAVAYSQAYHMLHFSTSGARTAPPEHLSVMQRMGVILLGVNLPRPQALPESTARLAGYSRVVIPGDGNVRLGAAYACSGVNQRVALLFHGYGGDKTSLLDEADAFRKLGFSVLLVDFRGSGDSSESYTTVGYAEGDDVAAAVDWVRKQYPTAKMLLYGQSMGAAAILRAVHAKNVRADAIILESVFDRMVTTVSNRFRTMGLPAFPAARLLVFWGGIETGFDAFGHNPCEYARRVTCPTLFLHGARDPRATVDDARRVFDNISAPKQFITFDGADHEDLLHFGPEQWHSAVAAFLGSTELIGTDLRQNAPLLGVQG